VQYSNINGLSCVSLDQNFNLKNIPELNDKIAFQGNLNPETLISEKGKIVSEVKDILLAFKEYPHIFNLGHGVLPATPIENVRAMIDTIRGG